MHFITKMFALAAIVVGATVASDAAADGDEDRPSGAPVDIETAKKIITGKLKTAQDLATANCPGRRDETGKLGSHGTIRLTILVSHLGHTAPIAITTGKGATAKCVAAYFTFSHPPYKGPDVEREYGVMLKEPKP